MRLALLGCDESFKALLRDLPPEHQLVAVFEANPNDLPLCALMPEVQRSDQWESLLIRDDIDLILVASPTHLPAPEEGFDPQVRRVDQLKKLAQAGCSLLVSFPAAELLDAYEIEMLRREGNGRIEPWFPGLSRPWRDLWTLWELDEAPANQVRIEWERSVDRDTANAVQTALVRDLYIIEWLAGKIARVTALGVPAERTSATSWRSLSVQIETAAGMMIRWTILPKQSNLGGRITVAIGELEHQLRIPQEKSAAWEVRDSSVRFNDNETRFTLGWFNQSMKRGDNRTAWFDSCRSLEVLAAVNKSLDRARTVELSQAEQTEEYQFKGVMASGGCMLLMLILLAVFVVALVEGLQLPLRNSTIWRLWPLALIVPLAAFLGLQFLQAVIQKPQQRS